MGTSFETKWEGVEYKLYKRLIKKLYHTSWEYCSGSTTTSYRGCMLILKGITSRIKEFQKKNIHMYKRANVIHIFEIRKIDKNKNLLEGEEIIMKRRFDINMKRYSVYDERFPNQR